MKQLIEAALKWLVEKVGKLITFLYTNKDKVSVVIGSPPKNSWFTFLMGKLATLSLRKKVRFVLDKVTTVVRPMPNTTVAYAPLVINI